MSDRDRIASVSTMTVPRLIYTAAGSPAGYGEPMTGVCCLCGADADRGHPWETWVTPSSITTTGRLNTASGRYRGYHMPVFYRSALSVHWYVVGDPDPIPRLLRHGIRCRVSCRGDRARAKERRATEGTRNGLRA